MTVNPDSLPCCRVLSPNGSKLVYSAIFSSMLKEERKHVSLPALEGGAGGGCQSNVKHDVDLSIGRAAAESSS